MSSGLSPTILNRRPPFLLRRGNALPSTGAHGALGLYRLFGGLLELFPPQPLRFRHSATGGSADFSSGRFGIGLGSPRWASTVQHLSDLGHSRIDPVLLDLKSLQSCGEDVGGELELGHVIRLYELTILYHSAVSKGALAVWDGMRSPPYRCLPGSQASRVCRHHKFSVDE
jgi:hypothetical protein